jgi:uncharacterized protein YceH (UPF0502 family)
MYPYKSVDEVLQSLSDLSEYGLIERLARLPGHKESRYAHLLGSQQESQPPEEVSPASAGRPSLHDRIETLEQTVASLQSEIEDLKNAFQAFKAQFE